MFDRLLLAGLSWCAWIVLSLYLTGATSLEDAKAGAAIAVQGFGDFQNFNPHLHVIATDGCFKERGGFKVWPPSRTVDLEELFRYEVFKLLKKENLVTDAVIEKILRHLGLWETRSHDPPKSGDQLPATHESELIYDGTYSQLPPIDYWIR